MKILFRVVAALLALCVFPAAYFLSFFKFAISAVVMNIADDVSIHSAVKFFADPDSPAGALLRDTGGFWKNEWIEPLKPAGISFLVFFALALVLALVIFFFAAFSNKRLVVTCLGVAGVLAMIGVYISFGRFAAPLLDGTITLTSIISTEELSFLLSITVSLLGSVVELKMFQLTSATLVMSLIFAGIAIWGLAFIITQDENERKKERELRAAKKKKKAAKKAHA